VTEPKTIEENGKKMYTLYTVTTETNLKDYNGGKFVVTRRYKDFAWLKGILNEKLDKEKEGGTIAPLPGDTVASFLGFGRFDDKFIEERRKGLQEFLNSVTNHIVTRFEPRLRNFLTDPNWTPDEKK
jgi:hypothetical protein